MKATRKITLLALALAAIILTYHSEARAHAVFIFAWPQGDSICTQSYFSGKSPVRGGTVLIQDADGQLLDSAKTDDQGDVCFNRPQTTSDLTFVVEAGEGHRADFTLRAADLPPLEPSAATAGEVSTSEAEASASPAGTTGEASSPVGPDVTDTRQLRSNIREELGAQLGPIARAITESNDKLPTFKDILGGLGWLAGIFGLAFWFSARKQSQVTKKV